MQIEVDFKITESAISEIKKAASDIQNANYLRVSVEGGGCSGFKYGLGFDENADENLDYIEQYNDVKVVIDKKSALFLSGVTLDWVDDLNARGFRFINPNAKKTCGCGQSFQ